MTGGEWTTDRVCCPPRERQSRYHQRRRKTLPTEMRQTWAFIACNSGSAAKCSIVCLPGMVVNVPARGWEAARVGWHRYDRAPSWSTALTLASTRVMTWVEWREWRWREERSQGTSIPNSTVTSISGTVPRQNHIREESLTLAWRRAILRQVRDGVAVENIVRVASIEVIDFHR